MGKDGADIRVGRKVLPLEEFKPDNLPEDAVPLGTPRLVISIYNGDSNDEDYMRKSIFQKVPQLACGYIIGDSESDGIDCRTTAVQYYRRK